MSRISVIVPVYNASNTINRCIESILKQTIRDLDIIIVNDGSKDNSGELCDRYAEKDKRIKVIHKVNEGVSSARNIGIEKATGMYIMFVDSDDYIKPNICETLLNKIEELHCEVVIGGYQRDFLFHGKVTKSVYVIPSIESINSLEQYKENWSMLFLKSLINMPFSKLYRLDHLRRNNIFFNESVNCGEDLLFNLDVLKGITGIGIVNEANYIYECTEKESLTSRFDEKKDTLDRLLFNATLDYLSTREMLSEGKQSVALIYMRNCFITFEQMICMNNELTKNKIKSKIIKILNCEETIDAVNNKLRNNWESAMYTFVLKMKIPFFVFIFTKMRFYFKMFYRKSWKI